MKKILFLGLSLILSSTLSAKEKRGVAQTINVGSHKDGSKCGLTQYWEDIESQELILDFSEKIKPQRIKSLPKIAKIQLIYAANAHSKLLGGKDNEVTSALQAVKYLREFSEGEEVYVNKVNAKGKFYATVQHYPGGNHYGYIFKWGSPKPMAAIGDDEIICLE